MSAVHTAPSSLHVSGMPGTHPTAGSQVSVPLQTLLSLQVSGVPGTQSPPTMQLSVPLHALLSMQSASLRQQPVIDVWTQPSSVSQVSAVQRAPSSQLGGTPSWQPLTGSHVSTPSHASPSSHCSGVPGTQSPLTHRSSPLHTLLSMQSASV